MIDWTSQERELLEEDAATAWLARPMPGGIHCHPEGGDHGKWIKLGWAYNRNRSEPQQELPTDPRFSGHRVERREPAEPASQAILRPVAAANHRAVAATTHDQGKLAVDWTHEDQGRLHTPARFPVSERWRRAPRARCAPVGFETQTVPVLPTVSTCPVTPTRTISRQLRDGAGTGVL